MTPPELIESPAGSPVAAQVKVPVPPVAARVALEAAPTVPPVSDVVPITTDGALTVMVRLAVAVLAGDSVSLAGKPNVKGPAAGGGALIGSVPGGPGGRQPGREPGRGGPRVGPVAAGHRGRTGVGLADRGRRRGAGGDRH